MLTRRQALSILGAGAWAASHATAADQPFPIASLDHLEFFVSSIEKSLDFYTRVFGNALWKNNRTARRYLKLGACYMAMEEQKDPHVDHFTVGVENWDIAAAHKYFDQRGVAYKDYPSGRDLYVADPDGNRLQMTEANSWTQLTKATASPETRPANGESIFRPVGLDHILLNVSDPEKAALAYAQVLGPVAERNNNRIWFQAGKSRIGLMQTPAGQRRGVNHFCVSVETFDPAAARKKLEQAGIKLDSETEFRDPDSSLIQIRVGQA
jgi:catechol 2,3-dioxygenase-like lactoylglutathione lyase family enzyme